LASVVYQWALIIVSSLVLFIVSPLAKRYQSVFFKAEHERKAPSGFMLMGSLVISVDFCKKYNECCQFRIRLRDCLAVWLMRRNYFIFCCGGNHYYKIAYSRKIHQHFHHFLSSKFGRSAVAVFSILIAFRLFNEG